MSQQLRTHIPTATAARIERIGGIARSGGEWDTLVAIFASLMLLSALAVLPGCAGGANSGGTSTAPTAPAVAEPLPSVDTSPVAATNTSSALPDGWQRGVFMEVYVRGYQDSDGDGIGDLKGLTQRLDYLKELGVTGIWLMPVTQSQDNNHGYAVTNYRGIESQYGTLADFDELLRQAHARGIGVIVDYVINHSGSRHPAFLNSRASATNPFRDWYLWQSVKPSGWQIFGSDPWRTEATGYYFAPFSTEMPDFNLTNPSVLAWHHDNLRFWLNRGVDGFRFDAVGHLVENGASAWDNQPQNYPIMGAVRTLVHSYTNRYMVCEAPSDPLGFNATTACGSAFAFGLQTQFLRAAQGDTAALVGLARSLQSTSPTQATFLSNHDAFAGARPWDQLSGNTAQLKLAASLLLLSPGVPFLYYGEEIGMAAATGLTGDSSLRGPMSWSADTNRAGFTTGAPFRALATNVSTNNVADQTADPQSLRSHYRSLIQLRKSSPALARGTAEKIAVNGTVLTFTRKYEADEVLVGLNVGGATTATFTGLPQNTTYRSLLAGGASTFVSDANGTLSVPVSPRSAVVLSP